MSESENNNLDSFFRRRAQQANVEFNESDWLQLEARLNEELPIKSTFWYWLRKHWYAPIMIAFFPFLWLILPDSTSSIDEEKYNAIELSVGQMTDNQDRTELRSDANSIVEPGLKDLIKEDTESNINSSVKSKDINSTSSWNFGEEQSYTQRSTGKSSSLEIRHDKELKTVKSSEDINDKGYVVSGNGNEATRLSVASYPHFLTPIVPDLISKSEAPESLSQLEIEPDSKKHSYSSFIIGVGYSPDFSAVGMNNFIAPGTRWKIDLGYAFSPRFQLLSGVVLVNNKYEAYGDEYKAPARYWKNGIVADETYGECKMIDIPLNLRYNILVSGRHRGFISSGLSTYFLTKEDYYFNYYQSYPDSPEHWGTNKTSTYPFSIINITAGYEYMLKGHGSLQFEPYIKIPTGGVGWGNVDLYTIGIYFSYQYRFRP